MYFSPLYSTCYAIELHPFCNLLMNDEGKRNWGASKLLLFVPNVALGQNPAGKAGQARVDRIRDEL
jgi:hypothetical protein